MISSVECPASLRIGAVEFVSPNEIKVALDLEVPNKTATNEDAPPGTFPRINSYVLIAMESSYIVAQVEWITIKQPSAAQRKGSQDPELVDMPRPRRKMRVNPLGTLKKHWDRFVFTHGVDGFPSFGELVLIPTETQLKAIVESGENRRVKIGTSPMAANAEVCIDPDKLFGRHLAVLGNTGSGKSCSIAGLIQWSIDATQKAADGEGQSPSTKFIVIDPNGEYSKVFKNEGRVFRAGDKTIPLKVPLWLWNSAEWCALTQASAGIQAPLLRRALREMRNKSLSAKKSEDIPIAFSEENLIKRLKGMVLGSAEAQSVEPLLERIRTMLSNTQMRDIIADDKGITLASWIEDYVGEKNGCVTIIDLSFLPSDIAHVITAVMARMVFEALQRYRKLNATSLPTVLVMEEAHTFVKRYNKDAENPDVAAVCCQVFEKIAREGRKFGLGLVLSSQRPSELSPTVLSQCHSFLLHRISNARDQKLIHRLVPDNLRGLLRELPSLPTQQAVLLGWAAELPVMVKMNDLEADKRPHPDDPEFWGGWTQGRLQERAINWHEIATDWQQTAEDGEHEEDFNYRTNKKRRKVG